jgi:hypothetical protein
MAVMTVEVSMRAAGVRRAWFSDPIDSKVFCQTIEFEGEDPIRGNRRALSPTEIQKTASRHHVNIVGPIG